MPLLAPFVILPALELLTFLLVSLAVGFWAALGLIVLGSLVGAGVLRVQGMVTLARMRQRLETGSPGARLDGLWPTVAGLLLVLPGFLTDGLALALLLPPIRRRLARLVGRLLPGARVRPAASPPEAPAVSPAIPPGPVIDVEFEDLPPRPPTRGPRS